MTATGTPVILALITGHPYAIGHVAGQLSAIVQTFFPGDEGGTAISAVLSGRVNPSGKLPVQMPRSPGGQPSTYLRSRLAERHPGSSVDPTPLFAFGHGLSCTSFTYTDLAIRPDPAGGVSPGPHLIATDGLAEITCTVRNTGTRPGAEVVRLCRLRWSGAPERVPRRPMSAAACGLSTARDPRGRGGAR